MQDISPSSEDYGDDFMQWLASQVIQKSDSSKKLFTTTEEESYRPNPSQIKKLKLDEYGNEIEDDGYRNPGGGLGRPRSTNPASKSISIRATPDQHRKFLALGGCKWIKKIIDDALQQYPM